MSEKRVNIRITASTSDFDKAIKKAQQQIEKLADTIDDMGKGKFGDNLEKQLDSVTDAAKKMQKQLEEMQESLDDMNKAKMDKLEDNLEDATDSAKDLNEELEDTKDSLDDLNKAKMNNFEKQFEDAKKATETLEEKLDDVIDSLKDIDDIDIDRAKRSFEDMKESSQDLGRRIDDLLDNFDKLDSQDLNRLRNEFEQIQATIKDLDEDFENAVGDLDKEIQDAADEIGLFDRAIEDIDVDKFIKLEESIMDLDKYIDEVYQSMQDFSRENNSLETDKIEDYANAMERLGNTNSNLDLNSNIKNKSNKGSNSGNSGNNSDRLSNAVTELAGAEMISNRVTSAIQDLEGSINNVADSMRDMNAPVQETVKNYQDMVDNLIKTQEEVDAAEKEYKQLTDELDENNKAIDDYKQTIATANQVLDTYTKMQMKMEDMHSKTTKSIKEYESALSDAEKEVEEYSKSLNDIRQEKDSYSEMAESAKDYQKNIEDLRYEVELYNKEVREMFKIAKDLGTIAQFYDKDGNIVDNDFFASGYNFIDTGKFSEPFMELNRAINHYNRGITDSITEIEVKYRDFINLVSSTQMEEFNTGMVEDLHDNGYNDLIDFMQRKMQFFRKNREELRKMVESNQVLKQSEEKIVELTQQEEEAIRELTEAQERLNNLQSDDSVKEYQDNLKKVAELEKRIVDHAEKRGNIIEQNQWNTNSLKAYENEIEDLTKAADELKEKLQEAQNVMDKGNDVVNQSADEFNAQYKAYEKLSQRVKEYLEDESNAIVKREEAAKSFRQVADAMEKVYSGSSKLNNADLINKTLEEAAKYFKELNLVSTENIQRDLKRLGEIIEDKTEKIKRFKEANKEFGSDASKAAYGLEKQGEALKEYADSVAFVIKETNVLQKAWGDISVGDVDHLQIRPRIELLDNYEKKLKSAADKIQEFYSETQGPMTQEQQTTLEDWKIWEKNAEKLKEYNKALEEYFTTIMDSGGNIDSKFLDELGKFDVTKFAKELEKKGSASVVVQKQFNANKIALQEWTQTEKEARQEAVKNAEAALEQAKNNEKLAKSQEELAEATEKVEKAQEDLNKARESLKNFNKDASANVKELNEMAKALNKLSMAAEGLSKADIAKFDKSLASMLDRLDTFDSDIPDTFAALKEDISAVFADMDSLDFGDALGGLKDIGAGLLGKLPTELKVAATAAVALAAGLKECAEIGINQFSKGMDTISNALSGITGLARDIGQELVSAFENITDMDLDMSSLMEIPIEFEAQMKRVGAIAGVAGEEFEELEKKARNLGATTPFSASEVAEAMEHMGQAGWGYQEIMDGIQGVLSLSTIAEMELGKAAEFVTDAINTFPDMEVKDAAHLVDVLAKVSVSSSTSVAQMQRAFTNCAPVAGTLGISVEDLSMALGLMANQGVKGAKAGTALKNLMTNLSAPTKKQLDFIKEFNLEGAQSAIVNGDLIGGIRQFKAALDGLEPKQKNAIISTITGKEALSGVSALLNTTEADLAALEKELASCTGTAGEMSKEFEQTLKGSLNNLAGALEETTLQIFDKMEKGVAGVVNQLTTFINIINGIEQSSSGLTGIAGALEYLEEISQGWGDAIAKGIDYAFTALDQYINGKSFDNLLQVGTNIINGICDGIQAAADNGSLDRAISGAIKKIATWFSENLDTIVDAGKEIVDAISKGISENSDEIGEVIKSVMEMQTEIDKTIAHEKWKLIGQNLIEFICEGIVSKASVFVSAFTGFFEGCIGDIANAFSDLVLNKLSPMLLDPIAIMGEGIGNFLREILLEAIERAFDIDLSYLKDFNLLDPASWFGDKKKGSKKSTSSKKSSTGKTPDTSSITGKSPIDLINSELSSGKVKTDTTAAQIGQGISDNITKKLETMDATQLKALNTEMQNLQTTTRSLANGMATSFTAIQDASRTSFMGLTNIVRNQMLSCTNIIRNQAVSWYNIIANQTANARTIFTQKFMSMAAVARTQMVHVSNIIRNQAVSWYNVINNQITKARNAFTSQMISMAKVAATQMGKVSSSIKNAMTSIGKNISSGVSSGINSSSNSVSNSSKNFKDTVVSKFKSAFGIHSPSTVMRDEVGTYLALGIEEGIVNGATNINGAVNDTVNSINSRMSGINNSNSISVDTAGIKVAMASIVGLNKILSEMSLHVRGLVATFETLHMTIRSILVTMKNMVSSIRSAQMSSSRSMSLNVSTNYSGLSANALYAANNASTASLGGNTGALSSSASYAMSTGGSGTSGGSSRGEGQELHMHVNVDGRELARASARYIDGELKAMTKRENRKRGAK